MELGLVVRIVSFVRAEGKTCDFPEWAEQKQRIKEIRKLERGRLPNVKIKLPKFPKLPKVPKIRSERWHQLHNPLVLQVDSLSGICVYWR